jgi:hypothetical protein
LQLAETIQICRFVPTSPLGTPCHFAHLQLDHALFTGWDSSLPLRKHLLLGAEEGNWQVDYPEDAPSRLD